jgi:hypothetical protein
LGITQTPNPTYATTIAHHGIVPNNPDLVPILVNLSIQ